MTRGRNRNNLPWLRASDVLIPFVKTDEIIYERLKELRAVASTSPREIALVVDGATLYYAMQPTCKMDFLELATSSKVVVACRTAPLQKAEVVALVKDNRPVMTLAIGE